MVPLTNRVRLGNQKKHTQGAEKMKFLKPKNWAQKTVPYFGPPTTKFVLAVRKKGPDNGPLSGTKNNARGVFFFCKKTRPKQNFLWTRIKLKTSYEGLDPFFKNERFASTE